MLTSKCLDKRLRLVVVDLCDSHAFRQLGLAFGSDDRRDDMLASLEKRFCDQLANIASGLFQSANFISVTWGTPRVTHTNDGDLGDVVRSCHGKACAKVEIL